MRALMGLTLLISTSITAFAQDNPVTAMIGRLNLDQYKATIKGLTQFGDRREGTERNRKAVIGLKRS